MENNIVIAPFNGDELSFLMRTLYPQARHNISKIINFTENTRSMPNDPNLSDYTDQVELSGSNHITDNIYYTLHPENIRSIVQRKNA